MYPQNTVFISYRRQASWASARAIVSRIFWGDNIKLLSNPHLDMEMHELAMLELVVSLEDEFRIVIPANTEQQFRSAQDIVNYVNSALHR